MGTLAGFFLWGESWEGLACLFVCLCFLFQINLVTEVCVIGRDSDLVPKALDYRVYH